MKTYLFSLFNSINLDILTLSNYIPNIFIKYIFILKFYFIQLILNFNMFENFFFFILYVIFIGLITQLIYKLTYSSICYVGFELIPVIVIDLKQLKQYILINKFEFKFLLYYKSLLKLNVKQFLVGTGIFIFLLLVYIFLIIFFDFNIFYQTIFNSNDNNIYLPFKFSFLINFIIKIEFINLLFILCLVYIFLHIIFGLYNIFYDYLKDVAFILLFLSFFIFLILFNLFILTYNLEFYKSFLEILIT